MSPRVALRASVLAVVVSLAAACGSKASSGKEIKIAAAADLARAFEEVGKAFEQETGVHPVFTFGSTGLLAKQIQEGAPFDVFAAANLEFVDQVLARGTCDASTKALYARGRIVMWAPGKAPPSLAALADPAYKKIAIANPEHAPYGRAAKQALEKAGVWAAVEPKLVRGENVLQTLQYAQSGNVDVSIVALSLAVVTEGGASTPIDPAMHEPLDQALVVCARRADATAAAKKFTAFVASPRGREIMTRYGFLLPGESMPAGAGSGSSAARGGAAIDRADVDTLVDAWLDAQNGGDFAAYQALYADRFTGIKRVGARTWRFDRKGWLADRGRMFKAPMTVTADDRTIDAVGAMAVVRFRQIYTQRSFKDAGDKQLVVVADPAAGGALRIAREEMLRSTIVDGPGSPATKAFGVIAGMVVLGDSDGTLTGRPERIDGPAAYVVRQPLGDVPARWTQRAGEKVTLYPSGTTCTLGKDFVQLDLLTPHFGTEAEWKGDTDGDGTPDAPPLTGDALLREVQAGAASYLAGALAGCTVDARDHVAVLGEAPAPWKPVTDDALASTVEAAFIASSDYADLQKEFATSGGTGDWTAGDAATRTVSLWRAPDGKATLAVAYAHAGEGCGDFLGTLAIAYAIKGGKPVVIGELPVDVDEPDLVADVNGDGQPELGGPTDLWAWTGDGYEPAYHLDLGFRDCGC